MQADAAGKQADTNVSTTKPTTVQNSTYSMRITLSTGPGLRGSDAFEDT
jgi:hypothetical protein